MRGENPLKGFSLESLLAEALRSHFRGSEWVIDVYSLLIPKLVRKPTSLPSYPRGAITVSSWSLVRVNIL
jgi:hypothetical protein